MLSINDIEASPQTLQVFVSYFTGRAYNYAHGTFTDPKVKIHKEMRELLKINAC